MRWLPELASNSKLVTVFAIVTILAIEIVGLGLLANGFYVPLNSETSGIYSLFGYFHRIVRILVEMSGVIVYLSFSLLVRKQNTSGAYRTIMMIINIVTALVLAALLAAGREESSPSWLLSRTLTIPVWILVGLSALAMIVPLNKLLEIANKRRWLLSCMFVLVLIFEFGGNIWTHLLSDIFESHLADLMKPTLFLATQIDQALGLDTQVFSGGDSGDPIYGTVGFNARIALGCTGYEGMLVVSGLSALLLYLDPRPMKLRGKLAVFLSALVLVFILNAVRIALLVYIGDRWSSEVAFVGFHSYMGWINILITLVFVWICIDIFSKNIDINNNFNELWDARLATRAMPLAIFISTSLILHAISGVFFWLYPIPVLLTFAFIAGKWKAFEIRIAQPPWTVGAVAMIIFAIWIALVPTDAKASQTFAATLFGEAPMAAALWLAFRILGSVVVVPICEEMAFRGCLFPLISRAAAQTRLARNSDMLGLLISSLAFGAAHADVLAATVAGCAYGLLSRGRGGLSAAILAHGLSNAFLAIYVLVTEQWSYW